VAVAADAADLVSEPLAVSIEEPDHGKRQITTG
jgi:hypothetical protein